MTSDKFLQPDCEDFSELKPSQIDQDTLTEQLYIILPHLSDGGVPDISNQCLAKLIIDALCVLTTLAGGFSGSFSGCLTFVLSMLIGTASKHRSWTSSSIQTVKGVRIQHIYSRNKEKW